MSVTHLRLGLVAVKSRSSVLGAGCFVGSACVVVGVNALRDAAFQAHFPHRARPPCCGRPTPGRRCCASSWAILRAAVDAVRLGMHLPHGRVDPLVPLGTRARRPIERGVVARLSTRPARRTSRATGNESRCSWIQAYFTATPSQNTPLLFLRFRAPARPAAAACGAAAFSSRSSSTVAFSPHGCGGGANLACQARRLCSLTPTAVAAALNVYLSSDHQPHRIPLELLTKPPLTPRHFLLDLAHPSDLLQGPLSGPRHCPKVVGYRRYIIRNSAT